MCVYSHRPSEVRKFDHRWSISMQTTGTHTERTRPLRLLVDNLCRAGRCDNHNTDDNTLVKWSVLMSKILFILWCVTLFSSTWDGIRHGNWIRIMADKLSCLNDWPGETLSSLDVCNSMFHEYSCAAHNFRHVARVDSNCWTIVLSFKITRELALPNAWRTF